MRAVSIVARVDVVKSGELDGTGGRPIEYIC